MQIVSKVIANLAVTTAKIDNLAITTGKIAADAVTGAKIRLDNAEWLRGRNAANDGDLDIIRVNGTDQVEIAQAVVFTGASAPQSAVAPSVGNDLTNKTYVDSLVSSPLSGGYESITLDGTDITNQYVDLAEEVHANTLQVVFSGVVQRQGVDYTLSLEGGVTRVTFDGDLATGGAAELVATDVLECQYLYQ